MSSAGRPSLLFVSPRFLFPMDQGGKIRTGNILRGMKGGAFEVTLASPAPADVARLMGANRSFIEKEIPHLERLMVISPDAALSTSRIAVIGHVAPEDRPALLAGLSGHIVIDLAGMDALRTLPGITYEGLCW